MLDQTFLREQIEQLLNDQENALGHYQNVTSRTTDESTRAELELMLRDKKRHIELTQRLLEIVE
jgi:hypothetical protein